MKMVIKKRGLLLIKYFYLEKQNKQEPEKNVMCGKFGLFLDMANMMVITDSPVIYSMGWNEPKHHVTSSATSFKK